MKKSTKGRLLQAGALGVDVGIPALVTVSYFPVWVNRGTEATVSGLAVILALICAVPALRRFKALVKSPSMPLVWTVLFIMFLALEGIVREVKTICLFGAISNFIGAAMHKCGAKMIEDEKNGANNAQSARPAPSAPAEMGTTNN